jgi:hypothetical protein
LRQPLLRDVKDAIVFIDVSKGINIIIVILRSISSEPCLRKHIDDSFSLLQTAFAEFTNQRFQSLPRSISFRLGQSIVGARITWQRVLSRPDVDRMARMRNRNTRAPFNIALTRFIIWAQSTQVSTIALEHFDFTILIPAYRCWSSFFPNKPGKYLPGSEHTHT